MGRCKFNSCKDSFPGYCEIPLVFGKPLINQKILVYLRINGLYQSIKEIATSYSLSQLLGKTLRLG